LRSSCVDVAAGTWLGPPPRILPSCLAPVQSPNGGQRRRPRSNAWTSTGREGSIRARDPRVAIGGIQDAGGSSRAARGFAGRSGFGLAHEHQAEALAGRAQHDRRHGVDRMVAQRGRGRARAFAPGQVFKIRP
jgi:hypothetical protein